MSKFFRKSRISLRIIYTDIIAHNLISKFFENVLQAQNDMEVEAFPENSNRYHDWRLF